jgi:hypothetical protein
LIEGYMATSVTQSLFGITPESIMQERSAAANRQALDFARLDPFEAARYGLFRGASQLGEGLTSAMGYEDPEIARAKARQGMLSGVDLNNPESLLAKAQSLQATDPMAAQSLAAQAQDLQVSEAKRNEIKYGMETKQVAYQNRFRALKSRFPEMSDEEAQGVASDEATFRQFFQDAKIKYSSDVEEISAELFGKPFNQLSPEQAGQVNKLKEERGVKKAAAGASRTTVDARSFNAAETEYGKVVGKDSATRDVNLIDAAEGAAKNLPKMYETRALIEKGDINTGLARSVQDVVSQAQSKFLADKKAGKNVSDSEYLDSLLGSDVFPQIAALGIGAKGLDTVAERKFLQEVITGSRDLSRDTLLRMVDFRIGASEKAVDTYNERLGKGEFKKYQDTTGRTLKKAEKPKTRDSSGATGQTSSGTTYKVIRN